MASLEHLNFKSQQLVDEYIARLRHQRRLSENSLKVYERALDILAGYCHSLNIDDWQAVTPAVIRSVLSQERSRGLSPRSLQQWLSAVRGFYKYLASIAVVAVNPAQGIAAPKAAQKLPQTLNIEQTAQLLDHPDNDPLIVRDVAMFELFYSSGLRLAELVGIDLPDMDLNDANLIVLGKGNKQRLVPVGRKACAAIADWLTIRQQIAKPAETAMFVSKRGSRIGERSVQLRLQAYARLQGLVAPLNPHQLRHSFASHMLQSSGDLRAVQEMLGHSNISTTQVYTHLDYQHLAKVYDSAHPRARRLKKEG